METNWSNGEQYKKVAATSRSPNVATFPRRDVSTSGRLQRRDVGLTNTESTI